MSHSEIWIQAGDVIRASRWPEPLKVDLVEPFGEGYVRLVGALLHARTHIDQVLPREEAMRLRPLRLEGQFHAPPRQVFLALEARRYREGALEWAGHPLGVALAIIANRAAAKHTRSIV